MRRNGFLWNYQGYMAAKACSGDETVNVEAVEEATSEIKEDESCFLKNGKLKNKSLVIEELEGACCFLSGWREGLCKCAECLSVYKANKVEFLLDAKDAISFYETLGKSKQPSESDENKIIDEQLSKMNRVSRVEFLHGVNDFKTELTDFLAGFASKGEVVKRENINAFFEDLARRKRQRMDANVANFYCQ